MRYRLRRAPLVVIAALVIGNGSGAHAAAASLSSLVPQISQGPVVYALGGPTGLKGPHLLVSIAADGTALYVDDEDRLAAKGVVAVSDDPGRPGVRLLTFSELLPATSRPFTAEVSEAPIGTQSPASAMGARSVSAQPARLKLAIRSGGSESQVLYLTPAPQGQSLGNYRIPTATPQGYVTGAAAHALVAPATRGVELAQIEVLQARFSVNDDYYNAAWGLLKANLRPHGPAVFLFGNSTMREASDATQLAAATSLPVQKLAFSGATPIENLMYFRKLEWRAGDMLVVHIHPGDFTHSQSPDPGLCMPDADWSEPTPISTSRSPFQLFADPRTCGEFVPPLDEPAGAELTTMILADCFAFYRMREIYTHGFGTSYRPERWAESRYSGRDYAMVEQTKEQVDGYDAVARTGNTRIDANNVSVKALRSLYTEATQKGVRLLLLEAPINVAVWGQPWDTPTKAAMVALAKELPIGFAPFGLFRDEDHYIDHNHLNAKGRAIYTSWLADLIRAIEAGGDTATLLVGFASKR